MHFCTARVAIAGDDQQVVYRNHYAPISWPEIEVLLTLHGDGAVTEIIPFVQVEQTPRDERARLELIYGDTVVTVGDAQHAAVYPGRNPNINMDAPSYTRAPVGTRWINPISGRVEVLTEDGSEVVPNTPLTIDSRPPQQVMMVEAPQRTFGDPRSAETPRAKGSKSAKYDDSAESPFAS